MDPTNLRRMIAEDELGLLKIVERSAPLAPEERLLSAYKEIAAFVTERGRAPEVNPQDMDESKLAMRLNAIARNEEQRRVLAQHDEMGLLKEPEPPASLEDALADDPSGLLDDGADIFHLEHVPKSQTMPDQIARRRPCPDFDKYEHLFITCHAELRTGTRKLVKFRNPRQIREDTFFVMSGVLLYVDQIGQLQQDEIGKSNARTRCIFENGTESGLLLQSLASNLYKDGKLITDPGKKVIEEMGLKPDTPMGIVYILRSRSDDEQVRAIPHLHKIGSTFRTTEQRTRDAVKESTYLMDPVEIVAEYQVPAGVEMKIEHLLHRLFASTRLDVAFERNGRTVAEAHEWFDVPLKVIDEAIELIQSETITNYEYDPDQQRLRLRTGSQ